MDVGKYEIEQSASAMQAVCSDVGSMMRRLHFRVSMRGCTVASDDTICRTQYGGQVSDG